MIEHLRKNGLSARAACRWSGFSRAVATDTLKVSAEDTARLQTMRRVTRHNPRYGYRRVAVQAGLGFGQTWRLWKQHDFRLAPQRPRPKRQPSAGPNRPCQADYPRQVWTYDILHDRLADGRPFKTLSLVDEFTRECLTILVAHSIRAEDVIAALGKVFSSSRRA